MPGKSRGFALLRTELCELKMSFSQRVRCRWPQRPVRHARRGSSYPKTKPASPSTAAAPGQRSPSFVGSPLLWIFSQLDVWGGAAGFGSPPRRGTARDVCSLAARAAMVRLAEEVLTHPRHRAALGQGFHLRACPPGNVAVAHG